MLLRFLNIPYQQIRDFRSQFDQPKHHFSKFLYTPDTYMENHIVTSIAVAYTIFAKFGIKCNKN